MQDIEEEIPLESYSIEELQDFIDNLYDKYCNFTGESKKKVKKNYEKMTLFYNKKVGWQAYRTKL